MSPANRIEALLADASAMARAREARALWVKDTCARWREAHARMDKRLGAAAGRLDEQEFERLCDEEVAKVDALLAPLRLAAERDVWPRVLYRSGI